jgi:hypothetical protein
VGWLEGRWRAPTRPARPVPRCCAPRAGLCALSGCHPEQNPALAGQNIYKSRQVQDTQIARLIGKVRRACLLLRRAGARARARPCEARGGACVAPGAAFVRPWRAGARGSASHLSLSLGSFSICLNLPSCAWS